MKKLLNKSVWLSIQRVRVRDNHYILRTLSSTARTEVQVYLVDPVSFVSPGPWVDASSSAGSGVFIRALHSSIVSGSGGATTRAGV